MVKTVLVVMHLIPSKFREQVTCTVMWTSEIKISIVALIKMLIPEKDSFVEQA